MTDETTAKPEPKPARARGPQKQGKGKKRGKRYRALAAKVERTKAYTPAEAVKLVKETAQAKFDTSVDLHLRMGVDPRHAEQMVRGSAVLPNGTGKSVRVAVFAQGDKAREAQAAGADTVGADDLAKRIEGGWLDFDVAIATPDMMGAVGKLGRILGPRGLMPNPKVGTVTFDVGNAVREAKGGKIEYRVEKAGIVHARIGKISFGSEKLRENAWALLELIQKLKPSSAKGAYMKSIAVSTTLSPSIKIDVNEVQAKFAEA